MNAPKSVKPMPTLADATQHSRLKLSPRGEGFAPPKWT